MGSNGDRTLILVTTRPGQPSRAALERAAASGDRPRKDYVELARLLNADVVDTDYLAKRATLPARIAARWLGLSAGQIVEGFLLRRRYLHIVAWSDRIGLLLALMYKLTRSRRDLVLISAWASGARKATLIKHLKVHTHMRAICNDSEEQMRIAEARLGVPRDKLYSQPMPVDERFWWPADGAPEDLVCSIGAEARDYATLYEAISGLDVRVELLVGSIVWASADPNASIPAQPMHAFETEVPTNVQFRSRLDWDELRRLHTRSRFQVIPLHDVEYNAGITTLLEAMAMGRAVVLTRTRGSADLIEHGKHGLYVPPGDPLALRFAIQYLLDHPDEAERMGREGRALVEQRHRMDTYTAYLAGLVQGEGPSPSEPEPSGCGPYGRAGRNTFVTVRDAPTA